jgi:hypothetical protein
VSAVMRAPEARPALAVAWQARVPSPVPEVVWQAREGVRLGSEVLAWEVRLAQRATKAMVAHTR